ncbi:hypothetical protein PT285_10055 [Lactobacillus sp. ESL0791]|uniref:hypothetical protein n=1 Tax=Lactobacillus sp. ESL0791 TaxID=2983234 RepID=UPI0023F67D29|nr:hypothetical protein [Lactobacillus sp. ESL0791]MDF7639744.1 hypothetical protein [Lactobacillus sp. ESL0791]
MRSVLFSTINKLEIAPKQLDEIIQKLTDVFVHIYLTISDVTAPEIAKAFAGKTAFTYQIIPKKGAADARRKALRLALGDSKTTTNYFYCDFDKVVVAIMQDKAVFANFIRQLDVTNEFLIVGRDFASFAAYPETWQRTEAITNEAASQVFKIKNLDITAGSCALGKKAAKTILQQSSELLTDTEWPGICRNAGIPVRYVAVSFIIYDAKYTAGRDDNNWHGYLSRLALALQGLESLNKIDQ